MKLCDVGIVYPSDFGRHSDPFNVLGKRTKPDLSLSVELWVHRD